MKAKRYLTGMAITLSIFTMSAQTISTEYAQPGIGGVVLPEFEANEFVEVLNLPINSKLDQAGRTVGEREQWLNANNTGALILNHYITDQTTLEKMKEDVRKSITQADLDMADISGLGEDAMINNIIARRLNNNYILFTNKDEKGRIQWEIYKIQLTPELYNAYINVMGTNEELPLIPMKFIKNGNYKQEDINSEYQNAVTNNNPEAGYAVFRRLVKDIPDLAIGGPVINNHPFRARMPKSAKNSKLQRFYTYRTVMKDGKMSSKNIGTAYVTRVIGQDTVQLYTLFGRNGSKKRGDYEVLTPGGRSAFSISGLYGLEKNGNYPRVRIEYDYLHWLSPIGVSGHVLGTLDVDFVGRSKNVLESSDGVQYSYIDVNKGKVSATHPNPLRAGLGIGYGVGYNFMGRFQIMPYIRVAGTYTTFLSVKDEFEVGTTSVKDGVYLPIADSNGYLDLSEDNKAEFFGIRGDVGAKFQINITNKLSIFLGAEYNYNAGFGKKSTTGISAAQYFYNKDYLHHGASSFNFLLGIRLISF